MQAAGEGGEALREEYDSESQAGGEEGDEVVGDGGGG